MTSLLDQLTAMIAGTFVLVAVVTIQMRDRVAAVETTVSDVAQAQAASVGDALAQEFDNVLSEDMAATELGTYRCRLARDAANEMTSVVEIPAFVRAVRGGAVTAATVRYQLVSAGRTVDVGMASKRVYRLTRQVDTGSGYGAAATVGDGIVDFDVKFRGRATEVFSGTPPLRFSQIAFQIVVAAPPPRARAGETRQRQSNASQMAFTIRPPNLTATL